MTVRELLQRIDSKELTEWQLFFNMEPWGSEMEDWRMGMIASTVANVNRDEKKKREPFTPEDFMPNREHEETPAQSPEDIKQNLKLWGRAWEEKFGE